MIDTQYMKDKADERRSVREEHARKLLGELIDKLCYDFNAGDPGCMDRDDVINLIEKFVTKRRRWL